jgi:hypothetical protein
MADTQEQLLTLAGSVLNTDYVRIVKDPGGTPISENVTVSNLLANAAGGFTQGFSSNLQIVPSVASNNLTVAIKTMAGADPSSTSPVTVRIGNTLRTITAALSVTKNAGTNWFGSGAAELATLEMDYFVYLGYNATDGVTLGFARIPYARQYSDFSVTTTNEKFGAISTITNAASTDYYENVGRFAATLSAGGGYTWTVPTFTAINLLNRPVFNSRWSNWTPTVTASSGSGYATTPTCKYMLDNSTVYFTLSVLVATLGSAAGTMTITLPFTPIANSGYGGRDIGNSNKALSCSISTSPVVTKITLYDGNTAWATAANECGSSFYSLI